MRCSPHPVRRAAVTLVAMGIGLALGATAEAHPQFTPTGSNRYLKLTLLGGGAVRLAYTVMIGEVPAVRERRAADTSGDGRVDAGEQAAAAARMARAVEAGLVVEVDGARRALRWEPPVAGFSTDDRVGPIPFSVDLVGRIDVGAGRHELRLDDETPLDDLLETEIRVEEGPGTRVLAGWQARDDGRRQTHFIFQGPRPSLLTGRSVGFRISDDTVRPRRRPPIALVGVLAGALVALVLVLRQRRRRRAA